MNSVRTINFKQIVIKNLLFGKHSRLKFKYVFVIEDEKNQFHIELECILCCKN